MTRRSRSRTIACAALSALIVAVAGPDAASPVAAQSTLPRVLAWQETLPETEAQEIRWPVGVASAAATEIAVADAHDPRLIVFHKVGISWQLTRTVELSGPPVGLVHDGTRYVVSIRGQGGLTAFEGEGLQSRRIGLPGDVVPGPLAAWANGDLLVYDFAGERALRVSRSGDVVGTNPIDGHVTGLATAPAGGFFAAVGDAGVVLRFNASGKPDARWPVPGVDPVPAWPAALAVEPSGDLLVVDRHGGRIVLLGASGQAKAIGSRRGWEPGLLRFPSAIALLPDGGVLVADEGNGRVQVFRRTDRSGSE